MLSKVERVGQVFNGSRGKKSFIEKLGYYIWSGGMREGN